MDIGYVARWKENGRWFRWRMRSRLTEHIKRSFVFPSLLALYLNTNGKRSNNATRSMNIFFSFLFFYSGTLYGKINNCTKKAWKDGKKRWWEKNIRKKSFSVELQRTFYPNVIIPAIFLETSLCKYCKTHNIRFSQTSLFITFIRNTFISVNT